MVGRPLSQGRTPTHAVITRATRPKRRPKARVAAEIPPIQIATDNLEFDLVLNRLDRFLSSFAPTIFESNEKPASMDNADESWWSRHYGKEWLRCACDVFRPVRKIEIANSAAAQGDSSGNFRSLR